METIIGRIRPDGTVVTAEDAEALSRGFHALAEITHNLLLPALDDLLEAFGEAAES